MANISLDQPYNIYLTDEQRYALLLAGSGESFKINAFAGTGKTTTIKAVAHCNPNKRCIYLAFNSSIANEVRSLAPPNLQVYTIHQYARRELYGSGYSLKLSEPSINYRRNIGSLFLTRQEFSALPSQVLMIGLSLLDEFCSSPEVEIRFRRESYSAKRLRDWAEADSPGFMEDETGNYSKLEKACLLVARKLWLVISSKENSIPLSFDFYLKIWQLEAIPVEADMIFIDEAQDLDPVMFAGISNMNKQLILVGDAYQQIYQWRGAVNAMEKVDFPSVFLTQTFRFPPSIAKLANLCLKKMGEKRQICSKVPEPSQLKLNKITVINRTNLSVISRSIIFARQGRKIKIQISFAGGVQGLSYLCTEISQLKNCQKVSSHLVSQYKSFSELVGHEKNALTTPEVSSALKLLTSYEFDLYRLNADLKLIIESAESAETDHEITICTAHAAKGKEWDCVEIGDDFEKKLIARGADFIDELRLFYVAITRAKIRLVNHQYVEALAIRCCS